jgi:hypothetical protein
VCPLQLDRHELGVSEPSDYDGDLTDAAVGQVDASGD